MTSGLHVGLMVPGNNTTMERELPACLPKGSRCTTIKIPRGKGLLTPQTLPAYRQQAIDLATQFARTDIDIVAYGCTAAGFIAGPAQDEALAHDLAAVAGRPVVTTARAMVQCLQEAGAKHIALVTPYLDAVNEQLKAFLADGGISVLSFDSFYAPDTDALGRIEAPAVAALARKTMTKDCDALFVACTQLPTRSIVDELCAEFGRPVLTSIGATARRIMVTLEAHAG